MKLKSLMHGVHRYGVWNPCIITH